VRLWQAPTGWVQPADFYGTQQTPPPPTTPPAPGARPQQRGPESAPGIEVTLTRTDGRAFRRVFLVGA
ncbi:MAG: hypothetical protein ACRECQ_05385, partial [Burkholderiaceae bacterium]